MQVTDIINAYVSLGERLKSIPEDLQTKARLQNPWFTDQFIQLSARQWGSALQSDKVKKWISDTNFKLTNQTVGIIMAGNIPMVGLHDLLCVIASGKKAAIKLSSNDEVLMQYAIQCLSESIPELKDRINTEGKLNGIDYLIATGSNNSARYFEYYFKGIPSLIRKNRTSAAVLSGHEDEATLERLADDIYHYFGLGCRNVTHLVLPRNMELKRLYEAYDKYMDHVNHHKYYNNYMYHKSILLMNLDKHYDNGFMLFQEKREPHAPIATLNYHYYDKIEEAVAYIDEYKEMWQCVVSGLPEIQNSIPFGDSQKPELWDYADNVDVMAFLSHTSH